MTQNEWSKTRKIVICSILIVAAIAAGGLALIYSGFYNVGADSPHTKPVYWMLDTARSRSVEKRAADIKIPADLASEKRILAGAGLYAGMCTGCHLAPGMAPTEIAQGLYPAAPVLARGSDLTPQEQFWTIKHGIKASGMAAWGKTHNDTLVWDMVAFLRKLPTLSPKKYRDIIASAPKDHDEMIDHPDEHNGISSHSR